VSLKNAERLLSGVRQNERHTVRARKLPNDSTNLENCWLSTIFSSLLVLLPVSSALWAPYSDVVLCDFTEPHRVLCLWQVECYVVYTRCLLWAPLERAGQLSKARILLADDHPHFPEIEERLLAPEFEVVGKVANGLALLEEADQLKPDVIITDISMPLLNGIEAIERLRESGSRSRVIFLTVHSDSDFVRRCIAAGAFGYVAKNRLATDLLPAIRDALAGSIFVTSHLTEERGT
jgi:CheY-like chemotaxis protein